MQRNLITFIKANEKSLFSGRSKSAKGDPYLLADLDRGVQIRGVGRKSRSAVTCVHEFCYKKPVLITRKHVNLEIKTYCYKRTA